MKLRSGGSTRLRFGTLIAVTAAVVAVALAPAAGARTAANLSLNISFFTNGTITVTKPDGTPVGTPSGAPTVIPAGYYALMLSGPGGCTALPHWVLSGPGESISDNLTEGEVTNFQYNAYFQPNATYTWRDDASPNVVYTFVTSGDVQGSPPPAGPGKAGLQSSTHGTAASQDLMGSGLNAFRGTLTGSVSAGGKPSVSFKGKQAVTLSAGKYTLKVDDQSGRSGFVLVKAKRTVTVTGAAFIGKRTATVTLTAGRWTLRAGQGAAAVTLVVK